MTGTARGSWSLGLVAGLGAAMLLLALAPLALPASYSWVELGTSESAAQGVPGAWVARTGFVAFGLSVLGIAVLRHTAWRPAATALHGLFGVSMMMVAVYSHAPWEPGVPYVAQEDLLHSVAASVVGFAFIAGVLVTLVSRRPRTAIALTGDVTALVVAAAVPLFMDSGIWGVLQRLMFLTAASWYAAEAWRGRPAPSQARSSPG